MIHYRLVFKGAINCVLSFDREMYDWWNTPVEIKEDGWLYIKGNRITNNEQSLNNFREGLGNGGRLECYVDATYIVDNRGYIICKKHSASSNIVDRFCCKIAGDW